MLENVIGCSIVATIHTLFNLMSSLELSLIRMLKSTINYFMK